MADKVTTEQNVQLMAEFADGDTRTITVSDASTADSLGVAVYNLQTFLQNNSVIIGDKNGASFSQFRYANRVTKARIALDLDDD